MSVKIIDKSKQFVRANEDAVDRALNRMAIDIERLSKEQVPHNKGPLKSSGSHRRYDRLIYHVFYRKEYALYQHEGGDGKRVVRNYSKPGKKKHYLIDPAKIISEKKTNYMKQEISQISI
jgi:hypothetical protein